MSDLLKNISITYEGVRPVKCRIECRAETSKSNAPNLAVYSAHTEELRIFSPSF